MTQAPNPPPDWAALVPELLVSDLDRALAFYCDACGFHLRFSRPEDGFAYIALGRAQIMLEEISDEAWLTGPLERPFGRGINLQIEIADVAALHQRLVEHGLPVFSPPETAWYREDAIEHGQIQFLVQDPDGYLLRFVQPLAARPVRG